MDNKQNENEYDGLDYCDLTPGKICDNCCQCLELDRDYNKIEARLVRTDRIDDLSGLYGSAEMEGEGSMDPFFSSFAFAETEQEYDLEDAADYDTSDAEEEPFIPAQVDPALMNEWEEKLRQYMAEQHRAYIYTLHGIRQRPNSRKQHK